MDFALAYKFAVDMAEKYLNEEDGTSANSTTEVKTIYSQSSHLYPLLAFAYPNLWTKEGREEHHKITMNEVRQQHLIRIRNTALAVASFTSYEFVEQVTTNMIDTILANSRLEKKSRASRALRRELEKHFREHPNTWFCIIASNAYVNKMVSHSAAFNKSRKQQQVLDAVQKTQTASGASK